ncbi:hypothetical protein VTO73DRAFT_6878 [Trametes versicolor]
MSAIHPSILELGVVEQRCYYCLMITNTDSIFQQRSTLPSHSGQTTTEWLFAQSPSGSAVACASILDPRSGVLLSALGGHPGAEVELRAHWAPGTTHAGDALC